MKLFNQESAACRCEWGVGGAEALATADVFIVVDVLSFTTCVDIATGRGAAILPVALKDAAAEFARVHKAELAGRRGESRYSLSPASFVEAPPGLRCVLPSPNGATVALRAAATGAVVLAGCLRNAAAVAAAAERFGSTFNVVPAGERWPDGSLRPAVEDWLAAGAILRLLPGAKSPEALAAIAAFEPCRRTLREIIAASGSGRELTELGYSVDVALATEFDVSKHASRLERDAFVRLEDPS